MKYIVVVVVLFTISFAYVYSQTEIPSWIKQEAKQLQMQNNLTENSVMDVLTHLSTQKIIKNPLPISQIYNIPKYGQEGFVKLSGRIPEYGKTAFVTLVITKPDGSTMEMRSALLETGEWTNLYPVNWKSLTGTYRVEIKLADQTKSIIYFYLTNTDLSKARIPPWFLTTFDWWIQGKISDSELVHALQHLIDLGIVRISETANSNLKVEVTGEKLVRRGTTHTINVLVTDGFFPIPGAKVTLAIEDYGKNVIREFDGFTNQNGYFVFSWEIPKSFDDIETLLAYISVSGNSSSHTQLFKFRVYCIPGEVNCKVEGN